MSDGTIDLGPVSPGVSPLKRAIGASNIHPWAPSELDKWDGEVGVEIGSVTHDVEANTTTLHDVVFHFPTRKTPAQWAAAPIRLLNAKAEAAIIQALNEARG